MENKRLNQRGSVLIFVTILMVVLLGFAALAVDIGHLRVVRNELQNAADAAALSGASYLVPQNPPTSPQPMDWATAGTQATNAIGLNKSDGIALSNDSVNCGCWDVANPAAGLQGSAACASWAGLNCAATPTTLFPAVQVEVQRSSGQNGGPVTNFLAPIIGINSSNVSATATAVMAGPGTALPNALFPIAIALDAANLASTYDSASNQVQLQPDVKCTDPDCFQWTCLNISPCSASAVSGLEASGNTSTLNIGDAITLVAEGTKTSDFKGINADTTYMFPVLDLASLNKSDNGNSYPIYGFICFHVTAVDAANGKYIDGYFQPDCYAGLTGGVGPSFGTTYAPPQLVQ
jgi:hypothetical protein